jgi:hypothetical protein
MSLLLLVRRGGVPVRDSECVHHDLEARLGLRPLAYHAPIDVCLVGGVLAALALSGHGIGSVWIGSLVGIVSVSLTLASIHCLMLESQ